MTLPKQNYSRLIKNIVSVLLAAAGGFLVWYALSHPQALEKNSKSKAILAEFIASLPTQHGADDALDSLAESLARCIAEQAPLEEIGDFIYAKEMRYEIQLAKPLEPRGPCAYDGEQDELVLAGVRTCWVDLENDYKYVDDLSKSPGYCGVVGCHGKQDYYYPNYHPLVSKFIESCLPGKVPNYSFDAKRELEQKTAAYLGSFPRSSSLHAGVMREINDLVVRIHNQRSAYQAVAK